jgi:uncharacterized membrane protein YhaH (DUF805 family)
MPGNKGNAMGFTDAVKSCLQKNYVGFEGRAPRSEYWFYALFYILVLGAVGLVGSALGGMILMVVGLGLFGLGFFLPTLAAGVRRLHDTNASGWWYLLTFIPYVGGLIMVVWFCIPGTKGENRFGHDPLAPGLAEAFD